MDLDGLLTCDDIPSTGVRGRPGMPAGVAAFGGS